MCTILPIYVNVHCATVSYRQRKRRRVFLGNCSNFNVQVHNNNRSRFYFCRSKFYFCLFISIFNSDNILQFDNNLTQFIYNIQLYHTTHTNCQQYYGDSYTSEVRTTVSPPLGMESDVLCSLNLCCSISAWCAGLLSSICVTVKCFLLLRGWHCRIMTRSPTRQADSGSWQRYFLRRLMYCQGHGSVGDC